MAGMPSGVRGDLDHHVVAIDRLPQPAGFVDRALGVVREIGRDFQADVAVTSIGLLS